MNRPIKFRIWDKKKNQWFKPIYKAYKGKLEEVLISPSGHILLRTMDGLDATDKVQERFVLQQYTGLKDKNGKEIYEGDIVEDTLVGGYGIIKFGFCKDMSVNDEYNVDYYGFYIDFINPSFPKNIINRVTPLIERAIKVIGNKFENPELLKED